MRWNIIWMQLIELWTKNYIFHCDKLLFAEEVSEKKLPAAFKIMDDDNEWESDPLDAPGNREPGFKGEESTRLRARGMEPQVKRGRAEEIINPILEIQNGIISVLITLES